MWGLCRSQQHLIVILAQGLAGQPPVTYRNLSIEFIGWTNGFFSWNAKDYKSRQYTTDLTNRGKRFLAPPALMGA